jgi:hypothetical protein
LWSRGIAFGGESNETPLDGAIAVMHRASAIRLIAGGAALFAIAGLVVVGASRSGAPAGGPPATLSRSQAVDAGSALGENRELSGGAHFIVVSTGEFRRCEHAGDHRARRLTQGMASTNGSRALRFRHDETSHG